MLATIAGCHFYDKKLKPEQLSSAAFLTVYCHYFAFHKALELFPRLALLCAQDKQIIKF